MEKLTQKISTILVAAGEERPRLYRDVKEVPLPVREQLIRSTSGKNSATLLIADEQGRKEIYKTLQGVATGLNSRFLQAVMDRSKSEVAAGRASQWRTRAEIVLLAGIGICLYLLASWK